jgi:hypothetical protein
VNVILQSDGTLGLIDYGMVGRLSLEERLQVAQVVVALAENDAEKVFEVYTAAGYDARTHGGVPHNAGVVHLIDYTLYSLCSLYPILYLQVVHRIDYTLYTMLTIPHTLSTGSAPYRLYTIHYAHYTPYSICR